MSKKGNTPKFLTIPRMTVILMSLVMIGLQFLPFWTVGGESGKLSIADVLWFTYEHPEAEAYFAQNVGANTTINSVILLPVFIFAACIVSFALAFVMKSIFYNIAPAIGSLLVIIGYLVRPEMRLGAGWYFHYIPAILMLAAVVMDFLGVFHKKAE